MRRSLHPRGWICSNERVNRTSRWAVWVALWVPWGAAPAIAAEPDHVEVAATGTVEACGQILTTLTVVDAAGVPVQNDVTMKLCAEPTDGAVPLSSTLIADRVESGCVEGLLRKGSGEATWRLSNLNFVSLVPTHPSLPGAPVPLKLPMPGADSHPKCEAESLARRESVMGWGCQATLADLTSAAALLLLGLPLVRRRALRR
jgi:hypothetical protein